MLAEARKDQIEDLMTHLQVSMWDIRHDLLGKTPSPFDLLNPRVIAHFLGLQYVEEPNLDRFGSAKVGYQVAGFLNRSRRLIAVSADLKSEEERRFTGAHEIAHYLLHRNLENLHRDRPMKGMFHVVEEKSPIEREANFAAGCILMPRKLVDSHFSKMHGCRIQNYRFTEDECWRLNPDDHASLLRSPPDKRARAVALAKYRIGMFQSLSRCFNVSPASMAIRLEELGLRAEWP
jgi:hypothetical protein